MSDALVFAKNREQASPLSGAQYVDTLTGNVPLLYLALPVGNYLLMAKGLIRNLDSSQQSAYLTMWTETANVTPPPNTATIIDSSVVKLDSAGGLDQACLTLIGKHTVTQELYSNTVFLGANTANGFIFQYSIWALQVSSANGLALDKVYKPVPAVYPPGYPPGGPYPQP